MNSETRWAVFSASRVAFWVVVTALAFFFGWLASVTFVAACSLYANIASDFAAFRADRNTEILKRLEGIEEGLERLDEALKELGTKKLGPKRESPAPGPLNILLRDDD